MLVGSEGSDRKWGKSQAREEVALFPLGPIPTNSATTHQSALPSPGEYLRLHPNNIAVEPR